MSGTDLLRDVPVGIVHPAPAGISPSVLVAMVGPLPEPINGNGRLTIDATLEMCRGHNATAVFIPGMFTEEELAQVETVAGIRLRGHTAMRNWACKEALEKGYDYLFLLENDAAVSQDTLARLMAHGKDITIPRLEYPQFPIIASMCFGPRPLPTDTGLLELRWAAHTAILFSRKALEKAEGKLFQGFDAEGEDHVYWQKLGFKPTMDLDTPIDVLRVARGHQNILDVPFRIHYINGKACNGRVFEKYRFRELGVYGCTGCDSEVIFQAPVPSSRVRPQEQNPIVAAYLARDRAEWAARAKDYGKLEWAKDKGYIAAILNTAKPGGQDRVLDIGCGLGYIARAVAGHSLQIYGLDLTPEMIALAKSGGRDWNITWDIGDIRAIPFPARYFDKVYARMVLHGLQAEDIPIAARECYRVLNPGGRLILSEGVPPNQACLPWFTEMFKLKEKRVMFTPARLRRLLRTAGFGDIETTMTVVPQVSIKNLLENSGLPKERQDKIWEMQRAKPAFIRRAEKATFTEDDIRVDMTFCTLVGVK